MIRFDIINVQFFQQSAYEITIQQNRSNQLESTVGDCSKYLHYMRVYLTIQTASVSIESQLNLCFLGN